MIHWLYSPRFRRAEYPLVLLTMAAFGGCVWLVAARLSFLDDPAVRGAVAFILVQALVQVILILGLIVSKQARVRYEGERSSRMRVIEGLLAQPEAEAEVMDVAARWPEEFLSVVEMALQSFQGSARARVEAWLQASSAYRRLLRDSRHSDPLRVIRALSVLGRLHDTAAHDAVRHNLGHSAAAVRRAARKAAVAGGDEELRGQVLEELVRLPAWERIVLFPLFPWDWDLVHFLEECFASQENHSILVALEVLLTRQRVFVSAVPARLARSENLEVRIKFFRALPFLRLDEPSDLVLGSGLQDPDWRVRAAAARACGSLRAGQFAGRLLEMCRSFEDSAEAGHAARALAALGPAGWARLREAAAGGADASHRIAVETMERRMVGRGAW